MIYKVYADDVLIHDSRSPLNTMHLIDPVLSLADSSAGSFSFGMTPDHIGYNSIEKFITTIIVYQDDTIIWTGRVLVQTEDFWNMRKFTCEGALAFLNDSIQPLRYYHFIDSDTFFTNLLTAHNTRVPNNRKVRVGTITKHDSNDPFEYKTEYTSTYDVIKNNLLDTLGGHLRVRYDGSDTTPIIDYLDSYPNRSSQEINFGENLLDFTKNWDLSNLCTVVIPRGKQLEEENSEGDYDYTTIASVNNDSIYLKNTEMYNKYGGVEQILDFNDVDDPNTLKSLASIYLSTAQFDDMILDVSAIDLRNINQSIPSFKLLDEVQCISKPHGLDRKFPVTKIDIPLDKPDGVHYILGGSGTTVSMSSKTVSSGQSFTNNLKEGMDHTLDTAKHNAALIMNTFTTGYVNIITENETSQAIVISETPDVADAEKLWRFNLNGLGYSSDGGETYATAITMDGTIVADFIKTGTLDASRVNVTNLNASNIKSGTISGNRIDGGTISSSVFKTNGRYSYVEMRNGTISIGYTEYTNRGVAEIASVSSTRRNYNYVYYPTMHVGTEWSYMRIGTSGVSFYGRGYHNNDLWHMYWNGESSSIMFYKNGSYLGGISARNDTGGEVIVE